MMERLEMMTTHSEPVLDRNRGLRENAEPVLPT